jgi:hypothetical protein
MSLLAIVLIALLLIAVAPTWSYSNSWGPGPSGLLGVVLLILVVLLLLGRI